VGGDGGLKGKWASDVLSGRWVVEVGVVGGEVGAVVYGRENCVVHAAGAEWGLVAFADGKRYRTCRGGLVGAALSCEVLGEGKMGVCVEFDVVGAAAIALICSSAP